MSKEPPRYPEWHRNDASDVFDCWPRVGKGFEESLEEKAHKDEWRPEWNQEHRKREGERREFTSSRSRIVAIPVIFASSVASCPPDGLVQDPADVFHTRPREGKELDSVLAKEEEPGQRHEDGRPEHCGDLELGAEDADHGHAYGRDAVRPG